MDCAREERAEEQVIGTTIRLGECHERGNADLEIRSVLGGLWIERRVHLYGR